MSTTTLIILVLVILWLSVCNIMTFAERNNLLNSLGERNTVREDLDKFKDVSYFKHLLYKMVFMNAMGLYK